MLTDLVTEQVRPLFSAFSSLNNLLIILITPLFLAISFPAGAHELPENLTELSLEALMEIEVTSVSKKPQKLANSATAIYVITQEDIRRSGVTSIPEALRLAPGVQVTHITNTNWGISIRGFNSLYANKLLVLLDGRSVYTPLYSGVYWDVQDTVLEDIERIEVIRGPGATIWGANAVNGVINIITKNAADTQDTLLSGGAGSQERAFGTIRYGDSLGENFKYRVYGKYFDRDTSSLDSRDPADSWNSRRGGFRLDGRLGESDALTFQGDIYDTNTGKVIEYSDLQPPYEYVISDSPKMQGGNLLLRWQKTLAAGSALELQAYYDRTERDEFVMHEKRDTYDLNFQHRFRAGALHELIWGFGYRLSRDDLRGNFNARAHKTYNRTDDLFSGFIQDEISLLPKKLTLTLGAKLEHNNYTGYEAEPNARILWAPNKDHAFWAAVSRAVRTPSRSEHDSEINGVTAPNSAGNPYPWPMMSNIVSADNFDSEELVAYEIGYRFLGLDCLTLDLALFYNDYDKLRTLEIIDSHFEPAGYISNTITFANNMKGKIYGGEVVITCQPVAWLNLQAIYSYQYTALELTGHNSLEISGYEAGATPHHQAALRSRLDLPENFELDLWGRYVDALPGKKTAPYITMDMIVGWKPFTNFSLDLVGQNLLDNKHPECEMGSAGLPSTEVERSVYLKTTRQF